MPVARLDDRGVLRLGGRQAAGFLQGLVTSNIESLEPGGARYAALLTPQGKIISDFFVFRPTVEQDAVYLDAPMARIAELLRRLSLYKLRADIDIADLSDALDIAAAWPDAPQARDGIDWYADPREASAGFRGLVPKGAWPRDARAEAQAQAQSYETRRIALALPKGGVDFDYGEAFPHEVGMDRLGGVDFGKGCYVGQEVVSRMHHRGTARNRIVGVAFDGIAPAPGAEIRAGDVAIGRMGSSSGSRGLAMMRMDRVEEARAADLPLLADGVALRLAAPET